tara:strand:+ start:1916 stop:2500 length:585 start_codon:yes stop_codon:yes gene_type:complete
MKINRTFEVSRAPDQVWDLFKDVPRVAACIPSTSITEECGDGKYKGRVEVKLGPITAAFEGDATHTSDPETMIGTISGTGKDRAAGSRAKFSTQYALSAIEARTRVDVESDVMLSGAAAQFGRIGLIEEVTTRMLEQFVVNLEAELGGSQAAGAEASTDKDQVEMGSILCSSFVRWLRALLMRPFARSAHKDKP